MVFSEKKVEKLSEDLKEELKFDISAVQFDYCSCILEETANKIRFERFLPGIKLKLIY